MRVPGRIVIASANPGKLRELAALLREWPVDLVSQSELGVTAADETGGSFVENALIKARHAAENAGLPAIADDSGIEVDVLGGAPGVRSARYAGPGAGDEDNLRLLLQRVRDTGIERPAARFRCAMVFVSHSGDAAPIIAQGTWEGWIAPEPRGRGGFGYDPVFFVPTHGCTSAELAPEVKNRISHRGQAMAALFLRLRYLFRVPAPAAETGADIFR
jgi:XTP/dITP diphosphohydrolase